MDKKPVVIITGASRGIGAWTAKWLSMAHASLTLVARSQEDLKKTATEIKTLPENILTISSDVGDAQACFHIVTSTLDKFGRIDALINNAGILEPVSPVADCKPDQFTQNIQVNFLGPFYLIQNAIPALRASKGRVINVSSGAAIKPIPSWSAYCSAKAALTHFTRILAKEEPRITSVAIRPGVVDTDMQALIREKGPTFMPSDLASYFINLKQKGKLESPWVPARVIAWLALEAPMELSGEFVDYDDPILSTPATHFFGTDPETEGFS